MLPAWCNRYVLISGVSGGGALTVDCNIQGGRSCEVMGAGSRSARGGRGCPEWATASPRLLQLVAKAG